MHKLLKMLGSNVQIDGKAQEFRKCFYSSNSYEKFPKILQYIVNLHKFCITVGMEFCFIFPKFPYLFTSVYKIHIILFCEGHHMDLSICVEDFSVCHMDLSVCVEIFFLGNYVIHC